MKTRPRLVIDKLRVSMGKTVLIEQFSHQFTSGTIVALIGDNGAGKTTLLKILGGLTLETTGKIFVDDRNIKGLAPTTRAALISFLLQHSPEQPYCTVQSRIAHGLIPSLGFHHFLDDNAQALIENMARRLAIHHLLNRTLSTMSGGEQRLVHIAKCLINPSTRILLLDEPSVFLDFTQQTNLINNLIDQRDMGRLVIFSSHDAAFIRRVADVVIMIKHRQFCPIAYNPSSLSERSKSEEIASFAEMPSYKT